MILTLEVKIETDEADAGELAIAVKDAITRVLEMPNGDAMYLDDGDVIIVVKDVSA